MDGPLNAANHIFAHRPPFPWQRNLGQNGLLLGSRKRFLRDFCAYREGGFEDKPLNAANCIFFQIDTPCHGTKFGTKLGLCKKYLRDFCVIFLFRSLPFSLSLAFSSFPSPFPSPLSLFLPLSLPFSFPSPFFYSFLFPLGA